MTEKRPVGFGRREGDAAAEGAGGVAKAPAGAALLDDDSMARLIPERTLEQTSRDVRLAKEQI